MTEPSARAAADESGAKARPTGSGKVPARDQRLRRRQDFEATLRRGRRSRHPLLHVASRCNGLEHNRYGFAVGRGVGKAVVRNRVKRRLRSVTREVPLTSGYDIITIAQPQAAEASYQELRAAFEQCARRSRLLLPENE